MKYAIRWSDATAVSLIIFFHNSYYPLKMMVKVGCNFCLSFTTEFREFQDSPNGAGEWVQGIPSPTSKPWSPKTKTKQVCRTFSLFAKAWVSITNTRSWGTKLLRNTRSESGQHKVNSPKDNQNKETSALTCWEESDSAPQARAPTSWNPSAVSKPRQAWQTRRH